MNRNPSFNILKFVLVCQPTYGRVTQKIKAEDFCQKPLPLFFPVGHTDTMQNKAKYVLDVNEYFKQFFKKRQPKALFSKGRYDMKKTAIAPHL
jgi:hypothetical protein